MSNLQDVLQRLLCGWRVGDIARQKHHLHQRTDKLLAVEGALMQQQTAHKYIQIASLSRCSPNAVSAPATHRAHTHSFFLLFLRLLSRVLTLWSHKATMIFVSISHS